MQARVLNVLLATVLTVASFTAIAAQSNPGAERPMYKWVDEKGVTHYGDSVPPQYAKQERHILNEQGVEVGRLEAEKSDAQRAEEEARRQSVANARQRDQILLTTYVSIDQIEQLRDQRLDLINGQVQVTTQYLDTLRSRRKNLHTQSQFFRPYSSNAGAVAMPDQLAEDLVRTVNEIRVQERNLTSKRKEAAGLRAQFQADIDRYRELNVERRPRS